MYLLQIALLALGAGSTLANVLPRAAAAVALPSTVDLLKTHRIHQQVTGVKRAGPAALAAVFAKYNKPMPPSVSRAASGATSKQSGSVQANLVDFEYICNVTVGATSMLLDFDTGSADLWVFSTALSSSQRGSHRLYGRRGKQTPGETYDISYGDGSESKGVVYVDTVAVGGVTATSESIGVATSVTSDFTSGPADGILGLAFNSLSFCQPNRCNTFMDNVAATLTQPLFTATLRHQAAGEYDFGFLDSTKYTGNITYVALTSHLPGFWGFTSGGYSVGSGTKIDHGMDCITDTGTSILLVDQTVAAAYWKAVNGASFSNDYGAYVFPCSAKLPNFSLFMGGTKHTMPGSYANYASLGDGSGQCYGGIQSDAGAGFCIVGDVFLSSQYVVFNTKVPQLGFAHQKGVVL